MASKKKLKDSRIARAGFHAKRYVVCSGRQEPLHRPSDGVNRWEAVERPDRHVGISGWLRSMKEQLQPSIKALDASSSAPNHLADSAFFATDSEKADTMSSEHVRLAVSELI